MVEQKTIWFLWLQGKEDMPEIVRMCYESWCVLNPGYQIVFLDESNITNYIDVEPIIKNNKHISIQSKSDVIRVNLLTKYGGVWVDATCYCMQPLSVWLDKSMNTGFFAFSKPGPDRMISNWFLAANKGNYVIQSFTTAFNNYWKKNPRIKLITPDWTRRLKKYKIEPYLMKQPTRWLSFIFTKLLAIYPYFCFHYLFEKIYRKNKQFKKSWDNTPKISSDIPHRLQHVGLNKAISEELKHDIDSCLAPVYKLSHKIPLKETPHESSIDYLMKHHAHILKSKSSVDQLSQS